MGGFRGRALATAVLPAYGQAGRIKGGGFGRDGRSAPSGEWVGDDEAMGEVWEINPWLFIRVPFSWTARRGRPCRRMQRQGRSLRAVRRMGWGMRKDMEEIWKINPWISIRVPFSRTARRGRPCRFTSILVGLAGARRAAILRMISRAPPGRGFPGCRSICSPDLRRFGSGDRRNRVANRFQVSLR